MSSYNCVLFDLDGTLVDTFEGIMHSYESATRQIGIALPTKKLVNEVIGAPLLQVFKDKFNLEESRAKEAVAYYREAYAKKGILEVRAYVGIKELLHSLSSRGIKIGVATLKNEKFAQIMLSNLELDQYIDVIVGMDGDDKLTKELLIRKALNILGRDKEESIFVGDSFYDAVGAKAVGIPFIGVTYGFGFKDKQDILMCARGKVANTPMEILDIVINM